MKMQRGRSHTCFWRPKMFAALMMIIAYCFLWSSFCDHLIEDNFKDNSPHCVLPSCSLFLSVFGFVLCFLYFFFCS
ncbi:hypothetical protein Peur_072927 [Populus x canadensis]